MNINPVRVLWIGWWIHRVENVYICYIKKIFKDAYVYIG